MRRRPGSRSGSAAAPAAGRRQQVRHPGQGVRHQPVVRPDTALLALQESGLGQDSQVVAHRRLADAQRLGELADARLGTGSGLHQTQQTKPGRIGERLEHGGETLGIVTAYRFTGKRGTRTGRIGAVRLERRGKEGCTHPPMVAADASICSNISAFKWIYFIRSASEWLLFEKILRSVRVPVLQARSVA